MTIQCVDCRHFASDPHDGYPGYCTFVPPASVASAIGFDDQDNIPAASVLHIDTCSLATPKGDGE